MTNREMTNPISTVAIGQSSIRQSSMLLSYPHRVTSIRIHATLLACLASVLVAGCSSSGNPKVPAGARSSGGLHATIETDKGPIAIEFLPADAPKAVENFRLLAEHGYYDG